MSARVAIVGAGKMGLPIACLMASRGETVVACDPNAALVARIRAADCPFDEPGLAKMLRATRADGTLDATTDTAAAVSRSDVVVVIVPVLLTAEREADLRIVESVADTIADSMRPGTLVVFETTLPVGTTRVLGERLAARSGKIAGKDFHLAFSPERVKSRHVLEKLGETPKVVGGFSPECARRAEEFYARALGAPTIDVGSLEAAEFAKLADMIYRDANIALANELAGYADRIGVDFGAVRAAANTSGEAHLLLPGIGVGGHCTPVYPWFAIRDAERREVALSIASAARTLNDGQADRAVERLEREWASLRGKRVLVLGLGFRPEVKEHTMSPAFLVRDALAMRGATIRLHDPLYGFDEIRAQGFDPHSSPGDAWAEALVLVTNHAEYARPDWKRLAANGVAAVLDGRNAWNRDDVKTAGIRYVGIGRA